MRPINPYIVGNPIKDQAGFFGRQDIFREVLQVLRQRGSNAIVLYGQRRIGKTSVLIQLEKRLAHDREFTPVYFDLQDKAAKSLTEVLYELSQHISKVTGHQVAKPSDFDRTGDYFRSTFLPEIAEKVARDGLVLLFDEFDVLDSPMRTQASEAFFPYLRAWMTDVQKVKFVFVIGRRPEDLSVRTMSTFKGIQSTRVSFLSRKDAEELVLQSEKDGTLKWDESGVRRVLDLTHGHPYFTQLLCSVIWENAYEGAQPGKPIISDKEVDGSVIQALKFGANAFNWLWDGLPPAERVVVAAMAEIQEEVITQDRLIETLNQSGVRLVARELEFAPETLIDWEVLIESNGAYRFAVPLLRRWVLANRPLRRVKEELDRLDPLAETLFQGGQGFYNNNNPAAAEQQLRQALNINPNHLKARLLLGQVLLEKGNLAESVDMFDAAFQYDERAARAHLIKSLLALAETQEENLQLSTYERILKIQSDQPLANEKIRAIWVKRGEAALAQENFEEALKTFEQISDTERIAKVRSLMHEKKLALDMQRASVYEKSGQWKSALDIFVELASEYPESETLQARLKRARMNWREESLKALDVPEAEEDWAKTLEICEALEKDFPGDPEIKSRIDRARVQVGVTQKYHQALGALQTGQTDQARQMLSEVLVENPMHLQAAHKLIEATYGKVQITRPLPWSAWITVGITSLVWILLGVLVSNGLVMAFLFQRSSRIPIETIILVAIFITGFIGIGVTLFVRRVLDTVFQVDIRGRPSFGRALWTHFPFGMGLFYIDHQARRKWLYLLVATMIPVMLTIGPFLYKDVFDKTNELRPDFFTYRAEGSYNVSVYRASGVGRSEGTWNTALGVLGGIYLLSFVDVMGTCYLRRKKQGPRESSLISQQFVPLSKEVSSEVDQSNQLFYGRAIRSHLNLGRGLFYVDPTARRRWVYPVFFLAIPISFIVGFLNDSTSELGKLWLSLGWTSILLYTFSFFDVLFTLKVRRTASGGDPGLAAATWWPVVLAASLILGYTVELEVFLGIIIIPLLLLVVVLFLRLWWVSGRNVSTPPRWRIFLLFSFIYSVFVSISYGFSLEVIWRVRVFLEALFRVNYEFGAAWGIAVVSWLLPITSVITFVAVIRRYGDQNYLAATLQGMIFGPVVGTAVGLAHVNLGGPWPLDLGISYALITLVFYSDYIRDQFKLISAEHKFVFERKLLGMLIALLPIALSVFVGDWSYPGPAGTVSGILASLGVAALLRYLIKNYGVKSKVSEIMPGQVKQVAQQRGVEKRKLKLSVRELPRWMNSPLFLIALGIAAGGLASLANSLPSYSGFRSLVQVAGLLILVLLVVLILIGGNTKRIETSNSTSIKEEPDSISDARIEPTSEE